MIKTVLREIKNSLGRYLAILSIIALGTGFLSGLIITKPAMTATVDEYIRDTAFYDFRLVSTLGYDAGNVEELKKLDFVKNAEGSVEVDALYTVEQASGGDDSIHSVSGGAEAVLKTHTITSEVNKLELNCGRMPEKANECVVDWMCFGEKDLGTSIRVAPDNEEDTLELLAYDEYVIVGVATSPSYINFERGNTSLGMGTVAGYVYIPYEGLDADYFTSVYLTLDETADVYTDEYEALIEAHEDAVTGLAEEQAQAHYARVIRDADEELADAQREYDEGYAEYLDGRAEYERERADADRELADAYDELLENEQKLTDGWADYRQGQEDLARETADAQQKLADAQQELDDALAELNEGETEYADGLAQYEDGLAEFNEAKEPYDEGKQQLLDAETEIETQEMKLDDAEKQMELASAALKLQQDAFDASMDTLAAGVNASILQQTGKPGSYSGEDVLDALRAGDSTVTAIVRDVLGQDPGAILAAAAQLEAGKAQLAAAAEEIQSGRQQLSQARKELEEARKQLGENKDEINAARQELETAKAELDEARKKLDDGWQEYRDGQQELEDARAELAEETERARRELSDAYVELTDGRQELDDGWQEYEEAKTEAEAEFADAEQELREAEQELADAREKLSDARGELSKLEEPTVYVLGRDANVGYVCFESDSNIVAGIARVFPLFFFLVAALVCITTMTRMVDEQRTQIGVYKAMGFSSAAIMGKYMLYSGSASLIGCLLGFFVGTYAFPYIIWQAYCMMYGFTDISYYFDPVLGIVTTAAYLGVSSLATYCACRSELKNVPAELIRPKTPKAGRRIFLERFPFIWKRVGFLHKVSIRNIVRYRQRMLMMILGIGGCSALLLTGFGIRDSIKNVVDFQYGEISLYEYIITFSDGQTVQSAENALRDCEGRLEDWQLVYESTMDIDVNGRVKNTNIVMPEQGTLEGFVDLHYKGNPVPYPKAGEAVICTNLAETFDLKVGDSFTVRDGDMNSLHLTVSGIFENYISNYIYVSPETFLEQWGYLPDMKTVLASPVEGEDIGATAAALMNCEGVNTVNSATEIETRIDNMMSSMDYIVWMIIVCSGALAFIVLYNLTNINITERIREIATIKVLGFRPWESANYVFRENIVLTVIGALIGLALGVLLHAYVMMQIQIDTMHFDTRIITQSYFMSLALTFAFAVIVDIVMYFKLGRINMAEALKSIE